VKRSFAVLTLVGAGLAGSVVLAAPASADASACLHVDISINGEGQAQDICLPPA
jgi:hypothetical protein